MKKVLPLLRVSGILLSIIFLSTAFSYDANGQGVFQKRKYRKGFYINLGKETTKKVKGADAVSASTIAAISVETTTEAIIQEQSYELPFVSTQVAYDNVEFEDNTSMSEKNEVKNPVVQLGIKDNTGTSITSEVQKWKQLKHKLDPTSKSTKTDLDPLLKKAILFAVVAVIASIFSTISGWLFLGSFLSLMAWLVAVAFWIAAIVFFILWLMEQ